VITQGAGNVGALAGRLATQLPDWVTTAMQREV
jgi:hypothetical protein